MFSEWIKCYLLSDIEKNINGSFLLLNTSILVCKIFCMWGFLIFKIKFRFLKYLTSSLSFSSCSLSSPPHLLSYLLSLTSLSSVFFKSRNRFSITINETIIIGYCYFITSTVTAGCRYNYFSISVKLLNNGL